MMKKLAILGAAAAVLGMTFGTSSLAGADELTPTEPAVEVTPAALTTTVGITLVAADDAGWKGDNDADRLCTSSFHSGTSGRRATARAAIAGRSTG